MHANNVIHRDLKPENLILDNQGYARITDLGVAKVYQRDNHKDTSGTPGYMAPEVILGHEHSYTADYFAIGVMAYEFMLGRRPYRGKNRSEIKQEMLATQVQVKENQLPNNWSSDAIDFINSLLQRKPENRLGSHGIFEIKSHPWLKNFNWKDLYSKTLPAPFMPKVADNYDKKYCDFEEILTEGIKERYEEYKLCKDYSSKFENYTCNNVPKEEIRRIC